jgi:DNA-binding CsgD family transcriptional regulator
VMPMAIKTDDYCNAVKIWINGELVAQGGEPGSAKEVHKAVKYNIVEPFVPLEGLNEIIFQTSNFEEYYGGFRHAILLGSEALVVAAASKTKLIDSFVLGVIFIMALYHFSLFWMNTENKAFLWFGLLALFIGLRMGLLSSTNIFGVWLNEQAVLFLRLSFLLALILPMTLFYYFSSVFPEYLRRRTVNVYGVLSLFAILFVFLLPVYYLSSGVRYFQFIISLGLAYLLFLILRFFKFMSVTEKIIGLGILLLLLSVVFEILIFNRVLYSDYVAHYGLLGFIVFQSFALSYDFHLASKRNIELTRELDRHNKNLQEEVEIKSREVLEAKQREMVAMALQKSRVNRVLREIEEKLILFKQQNKVESDKSFSEVLDLVKESKYNWKDEEYLLQFEKVHPQFFDKLLKAHPSLTKLEIHLCAYLKMNFGYQEIAHFQHIESESVRRSITRMRKKMELDSNRDIAAYLTLFS